MNGLSEAVIVCKGELTDPGFFLYLAGVKERLQKILKTDKETFHVKKLEKWNSVRITFHLPPAAAERLRSLAQNQPLPLHSLGIHSVQVDGNQTISVLIGPTTTTATADGTHSGSDESRVESGLGSSCASSDNNGVHSIEQNESESLRRTVMGYLDHQQSNVPSNTVPTSQSVNPSRFVQPSMMSPGICTSSNVVLVDQPQTSSVCNPVAGIEQMVANPNIVSNSPLLVNLLRSSSPGAGASNVQPCQTTAPSTDSFAFPQQPGYRPLGFDPSYRPSLPGPGTTASDGFHARLPLQLPVDNPRPPAPKKRKRTSKKKQQQEVEAFNSYMPIMYAPRPSMQDGHNYSGVDPNAHTVTRPGPGMYEGGVQGAILPGHFYNRPMLSTVEMEQQQTANQWQQLHGSVPSNPVAAAPWSTFPPQVSGQQQSHVPNTPMVTSHPCASQPVSANPTADQQSHPVLSADGLSARRIESSIDAVLNQVTNKVDQTFIDAHSSFFEHRHGQTSHTASNTKDIINKDEYDNGNIAASSTCVATSSLSLRTNETSWPSVTRTKVISEAAAIATTCFPLSLNASQSSYSFSNSNSDTQPTSAAFPCTSGSFPVLPPSYPSQTGLPSHLGRNQSLNAGLNPAESSSGDPSVMMAPPNINTNIFHSSLRLKQMLVNDERQILVNGREKCGQLDTNAIVNGDVNAGLRNELSTISESHLEEESCGNSFSNDHCYTSPETLTESLSVQIPKCSASSLPSGESSVGQFIRPSPTSITSNSSSASAWSGSQALSEQSGNVLSPVPSSSTTTNRRRNRRKADLSQEIAASSGADLYSHDSGGLSPIALPLDDQTLNSGRPAKRRCAQDATLLVRHSLGAMDVQPRGRPKRDRSHDSSGSSTRSTGGRRGGATQSRTSSVNSSREASLEPADSHPQSLSGQLRIAQGQQSLRNFRFSPQSNKEIMKTAGKRTDNGASDVDESGFNFSTERAALQTAATAGSPGLVKLQATASRTSSRRLKR